MVGPLVLAATGGSSVLRLAPISPPTVLGAIEGLFTVVGDVLQVLLSGVMFVVVAVRVLAVARGRGEQALVVALVLPVGDPGVLVVALVREGLGGVVQALVGPLLIRALLGAADVTSGGGGAETREKAVRSVPLPFVFLFSLLVTLQ